MSWANHAIDKLRAGEQVKIRPRGHSMKGRVESGQLVTLEPVVAENLRVGDIVLVRVKDTHYLHLVKARDSKGRFQIGNNRGGINGWVGGGAIYGLAIKVEP